MNKLPTISREEFSLLLKNFLQKNDHIDADLLFIDLFQTDSRFTLCETLPKRIRDYLEFYPKRKHMVVRTIAALLEFLCENNILSEDICRKEHKKIKEILKKL